MGRVVLFVCFYVGLELIARFYLLFCFYAGLDLVAFFSFSAFLVVFILFGRVFLVFLFLWWSLFGRVFFSFSAFSRPVCMGGGLPHEQPVTKELVLLQSGKVVQARGAGKMVQAKWCRQEGVGQASADGMKATSLSEFKSWGAHNLQLRNCGAQNV